MSATSIILRYEWLRSMPTGTRASACKLAAERFGWRIFFAYADPAAGEIGAVYQACSWLYLGVGVGRRRRSGRWRFFSRREGRWHAERTIRKRRLVLTDLRSHPEWVAEHCPDKHRYVWFGESRLERRELGGSWKYPPRPYPKRDGG